MQQPPRNRLAVFGDVLEQAASSGTSQPVFGVVRSSENLTQVLTGARSLSSSLRLLGHVRPGEAAGARSKTIRHDSLVCTLDLEPDVPVPDVVEFYAGVEGLDERRKSLVTGGTLADKEVLVLGAGTLGAGIAVALGQAGVGRMPVVDLDKVDSPNLSRHVCDLSDLGRFKATALADRLRLRGVESEGTVADITGVDPELLKRWIRQADLIVCTVDVPSVSFYVNELIVETKATGLFVGAYELASAGEIITVRPSGELCFYCAVGFRAGLASGLNLQERRLAYQSADSERLVAEPGLGIDVTYLASVAAACGLALLDPTGSRGDLLGTGFSLLHGPSVPRKSASGVFRAPLERLLARVARDEPCPICGHCSKQGVGA